MRGAALNHFSHRPYTRILNAMESLILPSGSTAADVSVINT